MNALPGWFKSKVRFTIDGEEWISDGKMAVRWPADPALREMPDPSKELGWFDIPRTQVERTTAANGLAVLGPSGYAPHFLDLVEFCHPMLKWHAPAVDRALNGAVAYVDGKPVGIVTPIRDYAEQPEYKGPPCPKCDGKGQDECPACEGSGEEECSHCGNDTECEECDGEGYVGNCSACDGSGVWKDGAA